MINDFKYTFAEIADAINGELIGENGTIYAISTDTREEIAEPWCFFAIKGENFNGASYINQAISRGAVLIITEEKIYCPVSVIYVENVRKALGLLGKHHKGKTKIIGITGSYGKTTVKDMVISVLEEAYSVTGTKQNYNNEIGVAKTLLSIKNEKFCVLEMGMRDLGEIEWLSYISEPETAIITGCGQAHIGVLGSKDNIFKAKCEILKYTKKQAILPYNQLFKSLDCKEINKIFVGENGGYFPSKIRHLGNKIELEIEKLKVKIDGIYDHNAYNAAFAYAVGKLYGISPILIKSGLEKWKSQDGRGRVERIKGIDVINDCYNASYESVISAIKSISVQVKDGKKAAVLLGDMLELGEMAKELHFEVGVVCRKAKISKLFAFGKYSDYYIEGFGDGVKCDNFDRIASQVLGELAEGDILLVKASHAVDFGKIIRKMQEI